MDVVTISENPPPEGLEVGWITGAAGRRMRAALAPCPGARATALIAPGRSEFIEKYFETARDLVARGFCVVLVDQRGQGLSDRLTGDDALGHMDDFGAAVADLAAGFSLFAARCPHPHVLVAHSMGGAIGLQALIEGAIAPDAAFFSAPMWGLKLPFGAEPLVRAMTAMGLAEQVAPGQSTRVGPEAFAGNPVTQDSLRHARTNALLVCQPRLGLAGPTVGWLTRALDLCAGFTPEACARVTIPVTVGMAGAEKLVDNEAIARVSGLIPGARLEAFDGAMHELLMEIDPVRARALDLIAALAGPAQPDAPAA